jgi:class 3 adenylate cyclase
MTRRAEYIGPAINASARITAMAHGGQVLMSEAAFNKLKDTDISKETNRIICLGRFDVPSEAPGEGTTTNTLSGQEPI